MRKLLNNKSLKWMISLIIIMNPVIDLIVSLSTHFKLNIPSVGGIIRGLYLLISLLYLVASPVKEYLDHKHINFRDKISLVFIGFSSLYLLIYFMTRPYSYNLSTLILEVNEVVRIAYFPIIFLSIYRLGTTMKFSLDDFLRPLQTTGIIYSLLILVPYVTGTGFSSYVIESLAGNAGWFQDANEVGIVLGIVLCTYILNISKGLFSKRNLVEVFAISLSIVLLGTKGSLLFLIYFILCCVFYYLRKLTILHASILVVGLIIVGVGAIYFTPAFRNIIFLIMDAEPGDFVKILLSGRITFLRNVVNRFIGHDIIQQILGIGALRYNDSGVLVIDKMIEMDLFELFFRYGFISVFIVYMPVIVAVHAFFSNKKSKFTLGGCAMFGLLCLLMLVSILVGHVVIAPSVSLIVVILIMLIIKNRKEVNL